MFTSTTYLGLKKTLSTGSAVEDSGLQLGDVSSSFDTLDDILSGQATAAGTNASVINIAGKRFINLYACSAGSIATITGMLTNIPFTMIMQSSGASLSLLDVSPKLLSAAWTPNTVGSNITLVWNGTNYIEIGRVTA